MVEQQQEEAAAVEARGAEPGPEGVRFSVWAPHAQAVSVVGEFNGWTRDAHPMTPSPAGVWACDVPAARPGHAYRYELQTAGGWVSRVDPRAREVTQS